MVLDFGFFSALPVAARCLELFARHVCIIRPVGECGRQKISADFNQVSNIFNNLILIAASLYSQT